MTANTHPSSGEAASNRSMRDGREPAAARPQNRRSREQSADARRAPARRCEAAGSDYIDFIDAPAVRDHLRTLPPLPPAQQCILIAQSGIKPLEDKLAALKAIRAATPPEDFARGCWSFQCDDPFPVILDRYLRTIRDLVARNLDAFLAHWDGKMTREELLDALKANL